MERMIGIRYKNATYSQVVTKGSPQASVFLHSYAVWSSTEAVEIVAFADDLFLFTKGKDLTGMTKDMQSVCDILF